VNDRPYTMQCSDGEERHLQELAKLLDGEVTRIKQSVGQVGDIRVLLMAGLLVADQLAEARRRIEELQDQINGPIAERIRAAIVVEAANGPTPPEGEQVLIDRGVPVLPDILCTAGGMVLSYFEWVQDMQSFFWTDAEIHENLDRIMDDATEGVMAMAEEQRVDLRSAATMLAVKRVSDATTLRGLYP